MRMTATSTITLPNWFILFFAISLFLISVTGMIHVILRIIKNRKDIFLDARVDASALSDEEFHELMRAFQVERALMQSKRKPG